MNERRARALLNTSSILAVILLCANPTRAAFGGTSEPRSIGSDYPDLAMNTNLWRTEFGARHDEADETKNDSKANNASPFPSESLSEEHSFGLSPGEVTQQLIDSETAVLSSLEVGSFDGSGAPAPGLNDWEHASYNATGGSDRDLTSHGPSAVTVVVGIVGTIVVFGTYFKSARRA